MNDNDDFEKAVQAKKKELEAKGIDTFAGEAELQIKDFVAFLQNQAHKEDVITRQRICETLIRCGLALAIGSNLDAKFLGEAVMNELPFMYNGEEAVELIPRMPSVPSEQQLSREEMLKAIKPLEEAANALALSGVHPQIVARMALQVGAEIVHAITDNAKTTSITLGHFARDVDYILRHPIAHTEQ